MPPSPPVASGSNEDALAFDASPRPFPSHNLIGVLAAHDAEGGPRADAPKPNAVASSSRKRSRSVLSDDADEFIPDHEEQDADEGKESVVQRPSASADHRSYTTWIPEEDKQLADLLATNKPWDEIAKAFPWRTKVSVMNRLYKMDANGKTGADKANRKRRVPPGIKRSDHHKWDAAGLALLRDLATDRKISWGEIGERCGGLTGKTVEGKWRRMALKDKPTGAKTHPARSRKAPAAPSTESKSPPAPEVSTKTKALSDSSGLPDPDVCRPPPESPPKCQGKAPMAEDAALNDEDAEGDVDDEFPPGRSPTFRSPAFLTKKNGIERNAAGWALPTAAAAASAALKQVE